MTAQTKKRETNREKKNHGGPSAQKNHLSPQNEGENDQLGQGKDFAKNPSESVLAEKEIQKMEKSHHHSDKETRHSQNDRPQSADEKNQEAPQTAESFDEQVKKAADEVFDSKAAKGKMTRIAEAELEKLKNELAEAKDRALRALAELENFRQRKNREMAEDRKYASLDLARDMLPVWDNLGRALEAAEKDPHADGFVEGVKMVHQQFLDVFQKNHIEKIQAEGKPFDPNFHESIAMFPSDAPAGTVIVDSLPGFTLFDRVVRPTQVVVSAPKPKTDEADAAK